MQQPKPSSTSATSSFLPTPARSVTTVRTTASNHDGITRLNSGNLLLVKHGSMKERTGRWHLTVFVSKDDGKTWDGGLLLDERRGVSYPDGQQTPERRK